MSIFSIILGYIIGVGYIVVGILCLVALYQYTKLLDPKSPIDDDIQLPDIEIKIIEKQKSGSDSRS